jgi:hypothetical protein
VAAPGDAAGASDDATRASETVRATDGDDAPPPEPRKQAPDLARPFVAENAPFGDERPKPEPPAAASPRFGWVMVAAKSGPGFGGGPWRFGAAVEGALRFGLLFIVAEADYQATPRSDEGLTATWFSAGFGGGLAVPFGEGVTMNPQLQAILQRLDTSIIDSATGRSDGGGRWLPGARVGLDVTGRVTREVGVVAGVEGRWLAAETDVSARGRIVATESRIGFGFFVGVRYSF